jgi:hypothetical protein
MEVANTLAYYNTATIAAVLSCIVQATGVSVASKQSHPTLIFANKRNLTILHSRVGSTLC